jgi:hypothetical protein
VCRQDGLDRYIYIPVGGSKNQVLATILVFSFVALWHDLSFKLLAWGWLVSLFILPEIIAKKTISSEKVSCNLASRMIGQARITDKTGQFGGTTWYRHLAAIGGVLNLWMMMCANLVGFVLGLEGMKHFLKELTSTWSGESGLPSLQMQLRLPPSSLGVELIHSQGWRSWHLRVRAYSLLCRSCLSIGKRSGEKASIGSVDQFLHSACFILFY